MTKREIFENFDNLSKDELNAKSNKKVYTKNDVMTTVIKLFRDKKIKKGKSKIDAFKRNQ